MKVICFETSINWISERNYRMCNWWHSFCNARKVISLYMLISIVYPITSDEVCLFNNSTQCNVHHDVHKRMHPLKSADRNLRSNDQRWWHLPNSFALGVSVVVFCAWCSQATSLPKQTAPSGGSRPCTGISRLFFGAQRKLEVGTLWFQHVIVRVLGVQRMRELQQQSKPETRGISDGAWRWFQ